MTPSGRAPVWVLMRVASPVTGDVWGRQRDGDKVTYQSRFGARAGAPRPTGNAELFKRPYRLLIFPGGKLLAERQKMFPASDTRPQAPTLRSGRAGGAETRPAGSAHRRVHRGSGSGEGRACHRRPRRPRKNCWPCALQHVQRKCALEGRVHRPPCEHLESAP